ncbi:lmo0937 family membrane protein [Chloroflexota bacterium]
MSILLIVGIILLILWLLGLFVFSLGALVHIALVIAVIFIIIWLLKAVFKLF